MNEELERGVMGHGHVLVDGIDVFSIELDRGTRSLRGSSGGGGGLVLLGGRVDTAELEERHVGGRDVLGGT